MSVDMRYRFPMKPETLISAANREVVHNQKRALMREKVWPVDVICHQTARTLSPGGLQLYLTGRLQGRYSRGQKTLRCLWCAHTRLRAQLRRPQRLARVSRRKTHYRQALSFPEWLRPPARRDGGGGVRR